MDLTNTQRQPQLQLTLITASHRKIMNLSSSVKTGPEVIFELGEFSFFCPSMSEHGLTQLSF